MTRFGKPRSRAAVGTAARQAGVSTLEYSLMAALIALAVAGTATTFGGDLKDLFGKFSTCVKTPASCVL